MEKERSLGSRAFFAVVLFFGFYVLALSVAAGLLFIPYLLWKTHVSVVGGIPLSCVALAGLILYSIVPRRDKFEPPGPQVTPEDHPRLFSTIETIARDLRQAMPREVYVIPICNAWVAGRGGIMGIGSRRVMAVGIPLLQTLSVPQLTAALAHEFGHYCGGDVKLGPWIYKTRLAITRTVIGLQAGKSILQIPFVLYGNAFLKITSSISRGQEFAADRMAASIAGAAHVASALKKIENTSSNFAVYWQEEVLPVLAKGFYPPVVMGFVQFLSSERAKELKKRFRGRAAEAIKPGPFDTHPTLEDRLAFLNARTREGEDDDSTIDASAPSAMTLLNKEAPEIEQTLMAWVRATQKPPLTPVSWQEVGQKVWPEIWKEGADLFAVELVNPATVADLPGLIQKDTSAPLPAADRQSDIAPPEVSRTIRIMYKYGSALAFAMTRTGWNPEVMPGATVSLDRGGIRFMPFESIAKLARREMGEETWRDLCRDAGILDLSLRP